MLILIRASQEDSPTVIPFRQSVTPFMRRRRTISKLLSQKLMALATVLHQEKRKKARRQLDSGSLGLDLAL